MALDWERIRAEYETTGETVSELARRHECSRTAIQKRAKAEGWARDDGAARRLAAAKVAGLVAPDGPKRAEAVEAEAGRRAAIELRHRAEWEDVGSLMREAIAARHDDLAGALERARLCKTLAEVTAAKQKGERVAWRLEEREAAAVTVTIRREGPKSA